MVESDLGVGFVPVEFLKNVDNVGIIDLKEEIPERFICLIKKRDRSLSIAAKELERLLTENGVVK